MIIDLILDRHGREKDDSGYRYDPDAFRKNLLDYCADGFGDYIRDAAQSRSPGASQKEYEMKAALCRYVVENEYNLNVIPYILSVNWTIASQDRILGVGERIVEPQQDTDGMKEKERRYREDSMRMSFTPCPFGTEFTSSKGDVYIVVGLDPKARKYSYEIADKRTRCTYRASRGFVESRLESA